MKRKLTNWTMLLIAATTFIMSCGKTNVNIGNNNGNTTIINYPPPDSTNNTSTTTVDSFLRLEGSINNVKWLDGATYAHVGNNADVTISWVKLPSHADSVQINYDLLVGDKNQVSLIAGPINAYIRNNSYSFRIATTDYRITQSTPATLIVTVVPLTKSGKKAATLKAKLIRE